MLTFNNLFFLTINLSNFQSLFSISQITAYFTIFPSYFLKKLYTHERYNIVPILLYDIIDLIEIYIFNRVMHTLS